MNNSYQQLAELVDTIKATGKQPTVKVLPSASKRNRKSLFVPPTRGKGSTKVSWLHPPFITLTLHSFINTNIMANNGNKHGQRSKATGRIDKRCSTGTARSIKQRATSMARRKKKWTHTN